MRFAWLLFLVDASRIGLARTAHCEFIALHLLLHIFASVLPQPSVIRSHSVALAALLVADSCPWTSLSCRFSVLLLQLLEFLPLGSAPCIAAAAHFPDVPAKSFCEYVSTIKRACLQKLRPLLELGFNAPCLSFRHQPALLWDPWLRPSELSLAIPLVATVVLHSETATWKRVSVGLRRLTLASPRWVLLLAPSNAFWPRTDLLRCALLHRVVAAPLQCQVARFLSVFVLLAFQISFLFLVPHSTGE